MEQQAQVDEKIELKVAPDEETPPLAVPAMLTALPPNNEPFDVRQPSGYREWKRKQRANRKPPRWTPKTLVLLVVGAIVLSLGLRMAYDGTRALGYYDELQQRPMIADGVVTEVRHSDRWNQDRFTITFKAADGQEYHENVWQMAFESSKYIPHIGQRVPVRYIGESPCFNLAEGQKLHRPSPGAGAISFLMDGIMILAGLGLIGGGLLRIGGADKSESKVMRTALKASRILQLIGASATTGVGVLGLLPFAFLPFHLFMLVPIAISATLALIGVLWLRALKRQPTT